MDSCVSLGHVMSPKELVEARCGPGPWHLDDANEIKFKQYYESDTHLVFLGFTGPYLYRAEIAKAHVTDVQLQSLSISYETALGSLLRTSFHCVDTTYQLLPYLAVGEAVRLCMSEGLKTFVQDQNTGRLWSEV